MFDFLDPRKVAARKVARTFGERYQALVWMQNLSGGRDKPEEEERSESVVQPDIQKQVKTDWFYEYLDRELQKYNLKLEGGS